MDNDLYSLLIEKTNQPTSIIQVIFNEIGDPVDYITLYMNPAAEIQLGLKREETIGRRAKEIRPNAEQAWFARYGKVAKTGISARYKMYTSTFDRYFDTQMIPLGNDMIGILFQDITELRDKEEAERNAIEALRVSEVKYRSIFETAQEGIWVIDKNDHTILVNAKIQQMLGYSFDEMVGQSPQVYMAPEFQVTAKARLTKLMEGIKEVIDYRFIKRDGNSLWCILSSTPLFEKNGKFDGSIAMITDITERKQAEESLRKSESHARELVRELEQADANKNEFISALSHELRNPLAAISAGIELLDITQDISQTRNAKQIMKRQMSQLCKLVDDLLDLTRITYNKINLMKEHINLNELVKSAAEDIRPRYVTEGIALSLQIQAQPIYLNADSVRIAQIIQNVLSNAIKFTPSEGNVCLTLKQEGNNAIIIVQDNGIGISPELLPKLFTPFTQADHTLDRKNSGLGLGLSIVKGMAELHGGSASAFSEGLGKGSTFTIRLPMDQNGGAEQSEKVSVGQNLGSLKILLIEDSRDFADILCSALTILGHEVVTANDGATGIVKAKAFLPDVIFCDIGLPGMDGFEVAKCLRGEATIQNVYMVALTGNAYQSDTERALFSGFNKHLAKPIDIDTIRKVLNERIGL